ncbi:MAG: hypothetical protein R2912_04950 [Eubacteriales bacterium]
MQNRLLEAIQQGRAPHAILISGRKAAAESYAAAPRYSASTRTRWNG